MTLNNTPVKLSYKAVAKLQRLGVWFDIAVRFNPSDLNPLSPQYKKWRKAYDNNYEQQ